MYSLGLLIVCTTWLMWAYFFIYYFLKKKKFDRFINYNSFVLPFYSISFGFMNFQFSFYKMAPVALAILLLRTGARINVYMFCFIYYLISIFIISYVYQIYDGGFEFALAYGRTNISTYIGPIVQSAIFLLVFVPFCKFPKSATFVGLDALKWYLYGCIFLVLIGYLQFIFYFSGIPWFDFWFLHDAIGRSIEGGLNSHALDRGYYRMSSLGGEPRHFGATCALAVILMQYLTLRKIKLKAISRYRYAIYALLCSGIILSLSASSLLALTIGMSTILFITNMKVFFVFLISISTLLILPGDWKSADFIETLLWKLSNFEMIIYAAKKDGFALQAIFHNIYYFIFGYGVNLADITVPDYYMVRETPFGLVNHYLDRDPMASPVVPTSALLQIFLSGGLVATTLFIFMIKSFSNGLSKELKIIIISCIACTVCSSFLFFPIFILLVRLLSEDEKREASLIRVVP